MPIPIDYLGADMHQRLFSLGYQTVDQLAAAAPHAAAAIKNYLGRPVEHVVQELPGGPELMAKVRNTATAGYRFVLGVPLDRVPRSLRAYSLPAGAPAPIPRIDLTPGMPPVRNQGTRLTCSAHAVLAAFEHLRLNSGIDPDMSEQLLYFECKLRDNYPGDGTWVGVAVSCLQQDGVCPESDWPYVKEPVLSNPGQGPPPVSATGSAPGYRVESFRMLAPTAVRDIKSEIQRRRCVAFSVPAFDSWVWNSEVIRTGDIVLPFPGEISSGAHAMCIVGYDDQGSPETGRFLVRNSWDTVWGTESSLGPGYGTIPYSYIDKYCAEAYSLE